MTSWSVYHGINKQTRVMHNPMSRTMLFFGYLRGPKMHLWIKKIWDTMINNFAQNFQDIMSQERAEKRLFELRMEKGELDEYTSNSNNWPSSQDIMNRPA